MSDAPKQLVELETIFAQVVKYALGLGAIILFIMLIMGGFKYISSSGDPKNLEGAKKTLTFAVAGVILLALAILILRLIEKLTGAPVTIFEIYKY